MRSSSTTPGCSRQILGGEVRIAPVGGVQPLRSAHVERLGIRARAAVKYAVFFRNLNLGRPNCPTKVQFEEAFAAAGAESASSFLSNGTIVFSVKTSARARQVLAVACQALQAECGLEEPAFVRSVAYLAELLALDPFASVERGSVYECCVSFLHAESITPPLVPLESKRGDVEVLRFTGGEAFSVSRRIGSTPGSPNAFLEKLLGLPVTTRNWNTVLRLVRKHA